MLTAFCWEAISTVSLIQSWLKQSKQPPFLQNYLQTKSTHYLAAQSGNGHKVGYMGDGINDAPSMKVADVGISG